MPMFDGDMNWLKIILLDGGMIGITVCIDWVGYLIQMNNAIVIHPSVCRQHTSYTCNG